MQTRSQLKTAHSLFPITFVPLLNLFLLLFLFITISTFYVLPNSIYVNLPRTITSDIVADNTTTITISSEDIIYFENKIIANKDLKKSLQTRLKKNSLILIKADGRTSLMRIIDVWNVCRDLGLENINIATTANK